MARQIAQKEGGQKGIVYSNKPQGEVEIGAAPSRCGLTGYHLKLDSFLS
jgi:S-adenosylmethionine synthetase